jgi:hypothetical protein
MRAVTSKSSLPRGLVKTYLPPRFCQNVEALGIPSMAWAVDLLMMVRYADCPLYVILCVGKANDRTNCSMLIRNSQ